MFVTEEIECILAKYSIECPTRGITNLARGRVEQPTVKDVLTLHVPLLDREGPSIRREVTEQLAPGLEATEYHVQHQSAKGSHVEVITRKGWGEQTVRLWALPADRRLSEAATLRIVGGDVKGKPAIFYHRDFPPVLAVQYRGVLETDAGRPVGEVLRDQLHQTVWMTVTATQPGLPLTGQERVELAELAKPATEPSKANPSRSCSHEARQEAREAELQDDPVMRGVEYHGGPDGRAGQLVALMRDRHPEFEAEVAARAKARAQQAGRKSVARIVLQDVEYAAEDMGAEVAADLRAARELVP